MLANTSQILNFKIDLHVEKQKENLSSIMQLFLSTKGGSPILFWPKNEKMNYSYKQRDLVNETTTDNQFQKKNYHWKSTPSDGIQKGGILTK